MHLTPAHEMRERHFNQMFDPLNVPKPKRKTNAKRPSRNGTAGRGRQQAKRGAGY